MSGFVHPSTPISGTRTQRTLDRISKMAKFCTVSRRNIHRTNPAHFIDQRNEPQKKWKASISKRHPVPTNRKYDTTTTTKRCHTHIYIVYIYNNQSQHNVIQSWNCGRDCGYERPNGIFHDLHQKVDASQVTRRQEMDERPIFIVLEIRGGGGGLYSK